MGTERVKAQLDKAFLEFRVIEKLADFGVQALDDRLGDSRRRGDAKPAVEIESRQGVGDGWNGFIARHAFDRTDGDGFQQAALEHGRRGGKGENGELHAPADRILHALRHGGVGDGVDRYAGVLVEPRGDKAGEVARSVIGDVEFSGFRLRQRDQLRQGVGRQVLVGDDDKGAAGDARDRDKILSRIIGQILDGEDIRRQRRRRGPQEGVTVRRGAGGHLHANDVARAGTVLDDETLAQHTRQTLRQQATDDVRGAAGRLTDDHFHRLRRPRLLRARRARQGACRGKRRYSRNGLASRRFHRRFPRVL